VGIYSTNLTSLEGLNNLSTIGGDLYVNNNALLTDFSGLNSLSAIAGKLNIEDNYALTSLSGLESLSYIRGGLLLKSNPLLPNLAGLEKLALIRGDLEIKNNLGLNSMTGLEKLTAIGGMLNIYYNYNLTTLSGLDNIDGESITDLTIHFNHILSTCAIQSICDYLANPNGTILILANNSGCDNLQEVETVCGVGLKENTSPDIYSVYANPTAGIAHFAFRISQCQWVTIKIYDLNGHEIVAVCDDNLAAGEHDISWNTDDFPPGIYFYRISTIDNRQSAMGKIVVMR
jgi:hypothetical protein